MNNFKRNSFYIAILGTIFMGGYLGISGDLTKQEATVINVAVIEKEEETEVNSEIFLDLNLEAKAAYVYDTTKNVILFAENETAQLPLASITKVMTSLSALKRADDETVVPITPSALSEEGDSGLMLGEVWRLTDLVRFMMITSSNDAARAISNKISSTESFRSFTDIMNADAKDLGFKQTYFLNPSGLDSSNSLGGAFGSAKDVTSMFDYALDRYPTLFASTAKEEVTLYSLDGIPHIAKNTNKQIETTAGIVASKTGFTDLAGGNLVIAYDLGPGKRIVATVLGSSQDGRFEDMEKLVEASIKYYSEN